MDKLKKVLIGIFIFLFLIILIVYLIFFHKKNNDILPIIYPILPIVNPILPIYSPILPIVNPILPIVNPILPIVNPILPIYSPILPIIKPILPIYSPILPIIKPILPIYSPFYPINNPIFPIPLKKIWKEGVVGTLKNETTNNLVVGIPNLTSENMSMVNPNTTNALPILRQGNNIIIRIQVGQNTVYGYWSITNNNLIIETDQNLASIFYYNTLTGQIINDSKNPSKMVILNNNKILEIAPYDDINKFPSSVWIFDNLK